MTPDNVIQALLGAFVTLLWYLYREIKTKVDAIEKDVSDHKLHVATNHVTSPQLQAVIDNLIRTVDTVAGGVLRIETRLNAQSDRRSNSP